MCLSIVITRVITTVNNEQIERKKEIEYKNPVIFEYLKSFISILNTKEITHSLSTVN